MSSDKPLIFISHAHTDEQIASILKTQIDKVFENRVTVFASSIPGVIKPGTEWLEEINENLEKAQAVFVIVTPTSLNRPWIWFEIGASWLQMKKGGKRIYPLCVAEVSQGDLPSPLSSLQAVSLGKAKEVQILFRELKDVFGFGQLKSFRASDIVSRMPKYSEVKIDKQDLQGGAIYSGPYEGYSDEELKQTLIDVYLYPEYHYFRERSISIYEIVAERNNIFLQKLVHYRLLDIEFQLPAGTSSRLLKSTAEQFGLIPVEEQDSDHIVRFEYDRDQDTYRD